MTGEYGSGTIRSSLAAMPRRGRVLRGQSDRGRRLRPRARRDPELPVLLRGPGRPLGRGAPPPPWTNPACCGRSSSRAPSWPSSPCSGSGSARSSATLPAPSPPSWDARCCPAPPPQRGRQPGRFMPALCWPTRSRRSCPVGRARPAPRPALMALYCACARVGARCWPGGTHDGGAEPTTGRRVRFRGRELSFAISEEQATRRLAQRILREPFTKRPWTELAFFLLRVAWPGSAWPSSASPWSPAWSWPSPSSASPSSRSRCAAPAASAGGSATWPGPCSARRSTTRALRRPAGFFGWLQSRLRDRVGLARRRLPRRQGAVDRPRHLRRLQPVVGRLHLFDPPASAAGRAGRRCGDWPGSSSPGHSPRPVRRRLHPRRRRLHPRRHLSSPRPGSCGLRQRRPAADPGPARARPDGDPSALARTGPDPDGRRLGRHLAPDRARPARRHPGPAGGARPCGSAWPRRSWRTPTTSTSIRSASWSTRPTGGQRGHRRAARHRPRHPPAGARHRPGGRTGHPGRPQRRAHRAVGRPADRPTPAIEAIAYFCVAELLANVAQHAQASRASVSCAQQGTWLRLVVRDDGTGGAQFSRWAPRRAAWPA